MRAARRTGRLPKIPHQCHDGAESDTGVDPLIEKRGADRGGEKDVDQDVVELEEKTFEQALTERRGKLVGSVPGKQRSGLGRGEPIPGLRAEFGQDVPPVLQRAKSLIRVYCRPYGMGGQCEQVVAGARRRSLFFAGGSWWEILKFNT